MKKKSKNKKNKFNIIGKNKYDKNNVITNEEENNKEKENKDSIFVNLNKKIKLIILMKMR